MKVCVLNKNTAADQVGNLTCRLSAHDSSHPAVLKNENIPMQHCFVIMRERVAPAPKKVITCGHELSAGIKPTGICGDD